MALDPKLIIGGAIVAAFLFGGKKKSSTASSTSPSTDKKDDKNDDTKGDVGEPVGPNGCKTGLIEKDGICIDPLDPKNNEKKNNGGGGSKPAASELIISKDCKSFQFGDKSGDSWWKNKGEKIAKQWVNSGELDPLIIAFKMISKTGSCFNDFPEQENYENWLDFNIDKFEWINLNRQMWFLLYSIRNRIDLTQFKGSETVQTGPDLKLKFGPNFSFDNFWNSLKPMALALLQLSASAQIGIPGPVTKALGIKKYYGSKVEHADGEEIITTYLFTMIFPNISVNEWSILFQKDLLMNIPLWIQLRDVIADYAYESIDLEEEGF